jgi:hypothetical protein
MAAADVDVVVPDASCACTKLATPSATKASLIAVVQHDKNCTRVNAATILKKRTKEGKCSGREWKRRPGNEVKAGNSSPRLVNRSVRPPTQKVNYYKGCL